MIEEGEEEERKIDGNGRREEDWEGNGGIGEYNIRYIIMIVYV